MQLIDRFLCSQQKFHQLRSKLCQTPQKRLFSTGEPKSKPRPQPQRRTHSKPKPRIQTWRHRVRRRHQVLSLLHQRKSFASILSDFSPWRQTFHHGFCWTVPGQPGLSWTFFVIETMKSRQNKATKEIMWGKLLQTILIFKTLNSLQLVPYFQINHFVFMFALLLFFFFIYIINDVHIFHFHSWSVSLTKPVPYLYNVFTINNPFELYVISYSHWGQVNQQVHFVMRQVWIYQFSQICFWVGIKKKMEKVARVIISALQSLYLQQSER